MERLRRTVVQLEEAKRFILDGEVARLRLAVILLDNSVEVMLHRRVSETLQHANTYARIVSKLSDGPLDAKGEELRQELSAELIPRSRQKQVNKYFGEKLKLLVEREGLQPAVASVLRHLHDYRNELQHHDHVRPESIRPAALILFDIAVDLMTTLVPGSMSFGSDDNINWLQDYGLEPIPFGRDDLRQVIANGLRSGLDLDVAGVREALIAHLTTRLDTMDANHAELAGYGLDPAQLAEALRHHERWEQGLPDEPFTGTDVTPFDRLPSLPHWRSDVAVLAGLNDKLELFDRFGTLEDDLEPLENGLQEVVDMISAAGEFASDIARGA